MPATSHARGHKIIFINGQWVYVDNKKPIDSNRACKHCGRLPTKEGYDACLGYIKGVKSACCGHGISRKYILKEDSKCQ